MGVINLAIAPDINPTSRQPKTNNKKSQQPKIKIKTLSFLRKKKRKG